MISATGFDWPIIAGPCGDGGPAPITVDQWAAAQDSAVAWLWALSGRKFGTWQVVWRPEWSSPPPQRGYRGGGLLGFAFAGTGLAVASCAAPVDPRVTVLPGPVVAVASVLVNGTTLPSSAYEVNGDQLLRVDGQNWPATQDTTQPTTAVGTWQITYTRGRVVPDAGQVAAGLLACEIAQAMIPGGKCALPANVTQVVRNGVTISKQIDQLNLGFTGLFAVDQWARTVNPQTRQSDSVVWSPDLDPSLYPAPAASS